MKRYIRVVMVSALVFAMALASLFGAGPGAAVVAAAAAETETAGDWAQAYAGVLKAESGTVQSVAVSDLTGDGTPELVYVCYATGPISLSVYTYAGGKAQRVIQMDQLQYLVSAVQYDVYSRKGGGLIVRGGNGGEFNYADKFYVWDDIAGEAKVSEIGYEPVSGYEYTGGAEPERVYSVDGKTVSKSAYDQAIAAIYADASACLARYEFEYTELRGGLTDISMTYEEALQYLQSDAAKADASEPSTPAAPSTPPASSPSGQTSASVRGGAVTATPTASSVIIDGKAVSFDAYNIADYNYFKLRDIAYALNGSGKQFEVGWDEAANAISLASGKPYTVVGGEMEGKGAGDKNAVPTSAQLYLDGKPLSLTAYNINDNNYFKLRDLAAAIDFGVDWDEVANSIAISTDKGYTPPDDTSASSGADAAANGASAGGGVAKGDGSGNGDAKESPPSASKNGLAVAETYISQAQRSELMVWLGRGQALFTVCAIPQNHRGDQYDREVYIHATVVRELVEERVPVKDRAKAVQERVVKHAGGHALGGFVNRRADKRPNEYVNRKPGKAVLVVVA